MDGGRGREDSLKRWKIEKHDEVEIALKFIYTICVTFQSAVYIEKIHDHISAAGHAFLLSWKDFRRVGERFAGWYGTRD